MDWVGRRNHFDHWLAFYNTLGIFFRGHVKDQVFLYVIITLCSVCAWNDENKL
jgi:hypothetical protein